MKADPPSGGAQPQHEGRPAKPPQDQGLQPWQFFVLAALASATAITFIVRGQGPVVVILLSVLMGVTALAGLAALRTFLPLLGGYDDRPLVIGERTRATLEREKMLSLRTIKELEFDRAMGKISDEDFREMGGRLRARAARLMKQLDAGAGYRSQIERDLAKRLGEKAATPGAQESTHVEEKVAPRTGVKLCANCAAANDLDARFCKQCGTSLA